MRFIARIFLFFVLFSFSNSSIAAERIALVLGINTYQNLPAQSQLSMAVPDAIAMGKTLEKLGFDVVLRTDVTRSGFLVALDEAKNRLDQGGTVFVFYAGHGVALQGTNLLLPSDIPAASVGNETLLRGQAVAETDIIKAFRQKGAKLSILVLDACRNNPIVELAREQSKSQGRTFRNFDKMNEVGLNVGPSSGVFSIYSAGLGQLALDRTGNGQEQNSVFTLVFARHLSTSQDHLVEIMEDVKVEVSRLASTVTNPDTGRPHRQYPAYYNETQGGRIFLRPPAANVNSTEASRNERSDRSELSAGTKEPELEKTVLGKLIDRFFGKNGPEPTERNNYQEPSPAPNDESAARELRKLIIDWHSDAMKDPKGLGKYYADVVEVLGNRKTRDEIVQQRVQIADTYPRLVYELKTGSISIEKIRTTPDVFRMAYQNTAFLDGKAGNGRDWQIVSEVRMDGNKFVFTRIDAKRRYQKISVDLYDAVDFLGADLTANPLKAGSASKCGKYCALNESCSHFSFNRNAGHCYLKSSIGIPYQNHAIRSGILRRNLVTKNQQANIIIRWKLELGKRLSGWPRDSEEFVRRPAGCASRCDREGCAAFSLIVARDGYRCIMREKYSKITENKSGGIAARRTNQKKSPSSQIELQY